MTSPSFVFGSGGGPSVTSGATTVSPASSSYAWSYFSGDSSISANSPISRTTTFSAVVPSGETASATFKVTTAQGSAFVDVSLERI